MDTNNEMLWERIIIKRFTNAYIKYVKEMETCNVSDLVYKFVLKTGKNVHTFLLLQQFFGFICALA